MTRTALWAVGGLAAGALLVSLLAGCSSTGGCRSCRWQSAGGPPPAPAASPGHAPPAGAAVAEPAPRSGPYGGQKKCPVTGEELGSMGEPVTVQLGGQTVYVCCKGCAKRALADPAKTLASVEADRAGR